MSGVYEHRKCGMWIPEDDLKKYAKTTTQKTLQGDIIEQTIYTCPTCREPFTPVPVSAKRLEEDLQRGCK